MKILINETQYKLLIEQSNIDWAYNEIVKGSAGWGTNPERILNALYKINNEKEFNLLLRMFKDKKTGYSSFEEMVNGEYESDNIDDLSKLVRRLGAIGIYSRIDKPNKFIIVNNTHDNDSSSKISNECINKYTDLLIKAKKYWLDWLYSPTTKDKFVKNWKHKKYKNKDVEQIFNDYYTSLNNLKLFFYNKETKMVDGNIIEDHMHNWYAFVVKKNTNKIFVNCSPYNSAALETLVHEIQHVLHNLHPLNPHVKVGDLFVTNKTKKNTPIDFFKSDVKNDSKGKIDTTSAMSRLVYRHIKTVSKNYNINQDDLKRIHYWANLSEKQSPGYVCSTNEKMSNVMSIRHHFNIKPGQDITIDMLKPYIKGEKRNENVNWLLYCWALRGFPSLDELINKMNLLAYQEFKKQDNTRIV